MPPSWHKASMSPDRRRLIWRRAARLISGTAIDESPVTQAFAVAVPDKKLEPMESECPLRPT